MYQNVHHRNNVQQSFHQCLLKVLSQFLIQFRVCARSHFYLIGYLSFHCLLFSFLSKTIRFVLSTLHIMSVHAIGFVIPLCPSSEKIVYICLCCVSCVKLRFIPNFILQTSIFYNAYHKKINLIINYVTWNQKFSANR